MLDSERRHKEQAEGHQASERRLQEAQVLLELAQVSSLHLDES